MEKIGTRNVTLSVPKSPASPSSPSSKDVVITGVGCVTPLGDDRETTWRNLLAGRGAGRRLSPADLHGSPYPLADEELFLGAPAALARDSEEPIPALIRAVLEDAARQAGLSRGDYPPHRAGCVIGSSKGDIAGLGRLVRAAGGDKPWTDLWPHAASSAIAREWSLEGPCLAPVAACATGLVCVLRGAELIARGECDLVIAGSADASLHPAILAAFRRLGVLSRHVDDPAGACRPFQADRDGFFVGEGAAVFILESRAHAKGRDATPLARWGGGALLSDPSGLTRVDPEGRSLIAAIEHTFARAGLTEAAIGHVNLHGTATKMNDLAEAVSLRQIFGDRLKEIPCLALKPAIGHLLGAAGAVELAISILAVSRGELPPTLIHGSPDPACTLPLTATRTDIAGSGLKISLGFGGHVVVGCFLGER